MKFTLWEREKGFRIYGKRYLCFRSVSYNFTAASASQCKGIIIRSWRAKPIEEKVKMKAPTKIYHNGERAMALINAKWLENNLITSDNEKRISFEIIGESNFVEQKWIELKNKSKQWKFRKSPIASLKRTAPKKKRDNKKPVKAKIFVKACDVYLIKIRQCLWGTNNWNYCSSRSKPRDVQTWKLKSCTRFRQWIR